MTTHSSDKEYLGDGVYADLEYDMLKLTAENGIEASDTIFLDKWVINALLNYIQRKIAKNTEEGVS